MDVLLHSNVLELKNGCHWSYRYICLIIIFGSGYIAHSSSQYHGYIRRYLPCCPRLRLCCRNNRWTGWFWFYSGYETYWMGGMRHRVIYEISLNQPLNNRWTGWFWFYSGYAVLYDIFKSIKYIFFMFCVLTMCPCFTFCVLIMCPCFMFCVLILCLCMNVNQEQTVPIHSGPSCRVFSQNQPLNKSHVSLLNQFLLMLA